MVNVDTLFVISSSRGDYPLDDLVAGINWGCKGSHFTVVVDEAARLQKLGVAGEFQILHTNLPSGTDSGFHRIAGLDWAVEQGCIYRQAILLSDECLIAAQGLDTFFLEHMQQDQLGVIGVRHRKLFLDEWRANQTMMFELGIPLENQEHPPISLADDVLLLTGQFIGQLYERRLLTPKNCEHWRGNFGSYLSWVAHLFGFNVISWGFHDRPLPPLYINQCQGQYLPPPQWLAKQFLVYSPVTKVLAYSEKEIRDLYKYQRGEIQEPATTLTPIVTSGVKRQNPG